MNVKLEHAMGEAYQIDENTEQYPLDGKLPIEMFFAGSGVRYVLQYQDESSVLVRRKYYGEGCELTDDQDWNTYDPAYQITLKYSESGEIEGITSVELNWFFSTHDFYLEGDSSMDPPDRDGIQERPHPMDMTYQKIKELLGEPTHIDSFTDSEAEDGESDIKNTAVFDGVEFTFTQQAKEGVISDDSKPDTFDISSEGSCFVSYLTIGMTAEEIREYVGDYDTVDCSDENSVVKQILKQHRKAGSYEDYKSAIVIQQNLEKESMYHEDGKPMILILLLEDDKVAHIVLGYLED